VRPVGARSVAHRRVAAAVGLTSSRWSGGAAEVCVAPRLWRRCRWCQVPSATMRGGVCICAASDDGGAAFMCGWCPRLVIGRRFREGVRYIHAYSVSSQAASTLESTSRAHTLMGTRAIWEGESRGEIGDMHSATKKKKKNIPRPRKTDVHRPRDLSL
jgi:hypothetical protein